MSRFKCAATVRRGGRQMKCGRHGARQARRPVVGLFVQHRGRDVAIYAGPTVCRFCARRLSRTQASWVSRTEVSS